VLAQLGTQVIAAAIKVIVLVVVVVQEIIGDVG
jgi:hypothetical protein